MSDDPIHSSNPINDNLHILGNPQFRTTEQTFGDQLHTYTIVDAINDKNVLPFHVDYYKTMGMNEEMIDEQVWDINREKAYMAPQRIELVTRYILGHFNQKTYRGDKTYIFNALTNISEVASAGKSQVEEVKRKQRLNGFNSIFAVTSVAMAKLYYAEFKKQMTADPSKRLRVALIYSYGANEAETDGIYGDSAYLGIQKRSEVIDDVHLSSIDYRINRRPSSLSRVSDKAIDWERHIEFLKSSVRCKVEHVFRIIKCQFGYRKTVYRGLRKNENRLYAMFACANLYALATAGRNLSPAW